MATGVEQALGERIRQARDRAVLTQPELAEKLGISWRSLQDYELGNATPRAKRRRAILAWLEEQEHDRVAA